MLSLCDEVVVMSGNREQEEKLAPAFQIAADVTEEEYRKAKTQAILTWVLTCGASFVAILLWLFGLRVLGFLAQAILAGVGSYGVLYGLLPEGRKMSTMRLKKYQELRRLRKARGKAQVLIEQQKKKE